jgi:hypothetical protein
MMRRAQSVFVILTLLALPLILLAQTNHAPACDGLCCVRHPTHSGSATKTNSEMMSCHHGVAGHLFQCGMHSNPHRTNNALLAPLPPTMLSAAAFLPAPVLTRDARPQSAQSAEPGFLSLPFEPPRS